MVFEGLVENPEEQSRFLEEADGFVVLDFPSQELDSPETHLVRDVLVENDFLEERLREVVIALESPPEKGLCLVDRGLALHFEIDHFEHCHELPQSEVNQAFGFVYLGFLQGLDF